MSQNDTSRPASRTAEMADASINLSASVDYALDLLRQQERAIEAASTVHSSGGGDAHDTLIRFEQHELAATTSAVHAVASVLSRMRSDAASDCGALRAVFQCAQLTCAVADWLLVRSHWLHWLAHECRPRIREEDIVQWLPDDSWTSIVRGHAVTRAAVTHARTALITNWGTSLAVAGLLALGVGAAIAGMHHVAKQADLTSQLRDTRALSATLRGQLSANVAALSAAHPSLPLSEVLSIPVRVSPDSNPIGLGLRTLNAIATDFISTRRRELALDRQLQQATRSGIVAVARNVSLSTAVTMTTVAGAATMVKSLPDRLEPVHLHSRVAVEVEEVVAASQRVSHHEEGPTSTAESVDSLSRAVTRLYVACAEYVGFITALTSSVLDDDVDAVPHMVACDAVRNAHERSAARPEADSDTLCALGPFSWQMHVFESMSVEGAAALEAVPLHVYAVDACVALAAAGVDTLAAATTAVCHGRMPLWLLMSRACSLCYTPIRAHDRMYAMTRASDGAVVQCTRQHIICEGCFKSYQSLTPGAVCARDETAMQTQQHARRRGARYARVGPAMGVALDALWRVYDTVDGEDARQRVRCPMCREACIPVAVTVTTPFV